MQRAVAGGNLDKTIQDIVSGLEAGDDPRQAIAQINRRIVDYQRAGEDVPPQLLRLSQQLSHECVAQSQGR